LGLGNDTESQHEFPSTELLQASNRSKYPLDAIIHLLVVGNPKRPGTKAYTKFDAFTEGQTVAQYLAAPGNGRNGEIKWCLDHNFISLDERIQEGA